MDVIAISDLRANLPSIIKNISKKFERLIITISGKPKAVVMSLDELESLEETAEILAVSGALDKIKKGSKEARKGRGISIDKFNWEK